MSNTKLFIDKRSVMQVLGCLITNPNLLNRTDKYIFDTDDFVEDFYKIIFGTVNNLKIQGLKKIEALDIDNYLSNRPTLYQIYNNNKGAEYISEIIKIADLSKFDYYYTRLKKMSLLRVYSQSGIDISWLYDPLTLDIKLQQQQEDWLDNTDIQTISNTIDKKIDNIKSQYLNSIDSHNNSQAGESIFELIDNLKATPEVGIPLYGSFINTITRGARLKKFYLRSAPQGAGKTRMFIADACNFSCGQIYDLQLNKWIKNGFHEPTLYITTEQEIDEIQTMMLAFLSGVQEETILRQAASILQQAPLWIEELHDFSIDDIENTIRKYVIDYNVNYICFDYIHTSLKILEEISKKSGGVKLREDNVLYMLSVKLKDLCNELGVFILSGTQLNGEWEGKRDGNQNLLRGAKNLADKIDIGMIMLPATEEDLECLKPLYYNGVLPKPDLALHIYKNRRGKYAHVKLWCTEDLGICRINPVFLTNNNYEIVRIEDLRIEEESDDD